MLHRCFVIAALAACLATAAFAASQGGTIPVPLPLFPPNNWWNTDISAAPVDSNSSTYISFIGTTRALHPDFGGDVGDGTIYGFPFIIVDSTQPKLAVTFDYSDQSDGVNHTTDVSYPFYPIPVEAITQSGWIEEGPPGNVDDRSSSDRHMLIVDRTNNYLYELYNVWYNGTSWVGGSGAFFDMNTNNRRPDTWTSADAAGLAILPGLVRYDEVYGSAEIGHAFRVTVFPSRGYVYPASHDASTTSNTSALPMGARLRLKANTNISSFTPEVQKIFRAFKKYGLIVADNGSNMYISGTYDTRWNNDVLNPAFGSLHASDFEVVQLGWKAPVNFIVAVPSSFGSGDAASITVTAYDGNYVPATGYTGTIHFSSSDLAATLPPDYTFTGADAGSHTFSGVVMRTTGARTITTTDISDATITATRNVLVGPPTPTALSATAASATQVTLTWNSSTGASTYEIARSSANTPYATIGTSNVASYADTIAPAAATYVYKVRALDSSSVPSPYGTPDAATSSFFFEDPLVAGSTTIKAIHLTEARAAVNLMRAAAGLSLVSFTDPAPAGLTIMAFHLQELRTALTAARSALGLPSITFTDPGLTGGTTIRAVHLQEIRDAVK